MTRAERRRASVASAATSTWLTELWTARSCSKSARPTDRVSAGSSAATVATRRSALCDKGQLAEEASHANHRQHGRVTRRCTGPHSKPALGHEV